MTSSAPTGRLRRRPRLVQGKLSRQVAVPILIGVIQLGLAVTEIARTPLAMASLVWLLVAFVVGVGFGSAIRVVWDDDALQVRVVGGQILLTLGFVLVSVASKAVLKHELTDQTLAGVLVLLVGSGLLLGHSVGLRRQIRRALPR